MEGIDDALQGVGAAVEVVGVELHGKAAALGAAHGVVPATADAQVGAFGYEMDHAAVVAELTYLFRGAVGGMVVHHYHIERERGFLAEHTADGIGNGAFAIAHGNDDRGLHGEIAFRKVHVVQFIGGQPAAYGLEMGRTDLFHLHVEPMC